MASVLLSLCRPRGKWCPEEKGGGGQDEGPHRPRCEVGVYQLTFQESSSLFGGGQGTAV